MSEELKSCPFCGSSGNCDTAFPHPRKNSTNWPNPERPGVPMFPERDGWHLLRISGFVEACRWRPLEKAKEWLTTVGIVFSSADLALPGAAEYIGPHLTPTQIAELLAGERERCAKECDAVATVASSNWRATACDSDNRAGDAAEETAELCAQKIRNLGAAP